MNPEQQVSCGPLKSYFCLSLPSLPLEEASLPTITRNHVTATFCHTVPLGLPVCLPLGWDSLGNKNVYLFSFVSPAPCRGPETWQVFSTSLLSGWVHGGIVDK